MSRALSATGMVVIVLLLSGCGDDSGTAAIPKLTATEVRSDRRAYDGAPPVIPHEPLGAKCSTCHTTVGMAVPNLGFAPANPHTLTSVAGRTQNCRQCHVFKTSDGEFDSNTFVGIQQRVEKGERAYPGAPPVIPHSELMRENCAACHSGPSARPEIKCSHTERVNCRQCHLFRAIGDT
ncbi:MAG: hypothetical protein R3C19_10685 [Planctomycetaceae bacterium]